jgi:hypothetical protein
MVVTIRYTLFMERGITIANLAPRGLGIKAAASYLDALLEREKQRAA